MCSQKGWPVETINRDNGSSTAFQRTVLHNKSRPINHADPIPIRTDTTAAANVAADPGDGVPGSGVGCEYGAGLPRPCRATCCAERDAWSHEFGFQSRFKSGRSAGLPADRPGSLPAVRGDALCLACDGAYGTRAGSPGASCFAYDGSITACSALEL
jgi:hypothetical protein